MQDYQRIFRALPELETKRLVLRPVTLRDSRDLYRCYGDPEVSRFEPLSAHRSLAETRAYIRRLLRQYRLGLPGSLAVVLKGENRVIGTVSYSYIDCESHCAEIGYSLARDTWNNGYGTEALRELLRFSFAELHLNRVEAMYDPQNPASGRVMEKCGMQKEGLLRGRVYSKGQYRDVYLYAILRKDFLSI